MTAATWLDKTIGFISPRAGLRRMRARVATELLARDYEAASVGRRTQTWRRSPGDANAITGPALATLRFVARDLVRNNGYAESALTTIGDHVVGWGIAAKPREKNAQAEDLWGRWAGTTACDADGRNDFAGLQKLVFRTVVESGEVLVRRRFRRVEDGLPIPLQLQVLEPDFLDIFKDFELPNGGRISQGVEFDVLGRRVAYWLFPAHPGSTAVGRTGTYGSYRIPATEIRHVFKQSRPGQVRGPSWFAPVLLRFKDFDEFEDATLMKQKIAACLAVFTTDVDGNGAAIGLADDTKTPAIDSLEPGMIVNMPAGRSVTSIDPPTVREYSDYTRTSLRAIATGLGVTYEDLTGDYDGLPFSAARMSRLRHWARVEDWRWRTLIPQFCDPTWAWAMEAAAIAGLLDGEELPAAEWTAPPPPMIDPANEGLAYQRNIRTGLQTLSEVHRERGMDSDAVLKEMATDNARLDELGIILDSDPRNTTQAGNPRQQAQPAADPAGDDPQEDDASSDKTPPTGGAPPEKGKPPVPEKKKAAKRVAVRYDLQGRRIAYDITEE